MGKSTDPSGNPSRPCGPTQACKDLESNVKKLSRGVPEGATDYACVFAWPWALARLHPYYILMSPAGHLDPLLDCIQATIHPLTFHRQNPHSVTGL